MIPRLEGGDSPDGRKVKGTLHWVSAKHALSAEVRLYEHLFSEANPKYASEEDLTASINSDSLEVIAGLGSSPV